MIRSVWINLLAAGFLCLCISCVGCGKKGPPRPPEGKEVAAPVELTYEIKEDRVHLRWKIEDGSNVERFEIFRARQSVADCNGCPVKFERIETVPADQTSFDGPVETGLRYYFRVRSVGGGDQKSGYSNTVRFEH